MSDTLKVNSDGSRRRGSSVGNMNQVGQHGFGLSTAISKGQAKRERLKKINSKKVKSKRDLFWKLFHSYVELSFRVTWLTPFLILVSILSCYLLSNNYTESNPLHMFVAVSYNTGEKFDNGQYLYGKGPKDFAFIFFYMIFFTFFREFVMYVVVRPIALRCNLSSSKVKRFMEQFYSLIYYSLSSPFGIYVMYQLPVKWFNTYYFYESFPHRSIFFLMKVFYLGQAAFWTQQVVVIALQLEKPRKDYMELVFHHIVTMCLIYSSYTFDFTWIGLCIYITMDVSDFFISLSKLANYLESALMPVLYLIFMAVWIYMRHYINLKILWSVLTEFKTVGPYQLNFKTGQYKCFISQPIVFVLLFALQLLNLYWLALLFRILYRYVFLGVAKDERSDDEDSDIEEEEYEGYSTDSEDGTEGKNTEDKKDK